MLQDIYINYVAELIDGLRNNMITIRHLLANTPVYGFVNALTIPILAITPEDLVFLTRHSPGLHILYDNYIRVSRYAREFRQNPPRVYPPILDFVRGT